MSEMRCEVAQGSARPTTNIEDSAKLTAIGHMIVHNRLVYAIMVAEALLGICLALLEAIIAKCRVR